MTFIEGIGGTGAAPTQGRSTALGGLGGDAFLQLLVAQMRYQDPMSPADHTTMLQQTSQFTQVETLQQVSLLQQQLLGLSQAGIASEMIGKEVVAAVDGGAVSGVVEGVRFTAEGPVLDIGAYEVPLEATTEVRVPTAAATGTAAADAWTGPWFHDDGTSGAAQDSPSA